MSAHIDRIIEKMGYAESSCLKYSRDGFVSMNISAQYKKVLSELSPYAIYFVDNAPFVLFYEENKDDEEQRRINRKIWNAQVPLTIICGAGDVRIYSSWSIDTEKSTFTEVKHLLTNEVDESSPFSYWEITNQNFWIEYSKQFSENKLNDDLLRNLLYITKKLREEHNVEFATKLTLRLIFIRYLIDRGVDLRYKGFSSDIVASRENFLDLLSDKSEIYSLFAHLKSKFNGNLFELGNEHNEPCLTNDVFLVLSEFFSANVDMKTDQLSLFNLYDFNIIPVELISNIYEILLGKEGRDKDNAFYTPQYLVGYILSDTISPFIRDNGACKVLDPSCGSGIFLVESYRRMVEKELGGELFTDSNELLQKILSENIYGIDLNEDAIDVAIFSLYLAVLDYKNPKTLERFELPNLKGENLIVADFFDEGALETLEKIPFNFIVGNPPWGSQKGLLVEYCKERGYSHLLQNYDTCRAFILRSKDFSSTNTQCCFVLHSKMLYMQKGPSKKFREFLLKNTKITRIIELSSVRKLVFKTADAPAVVLAYSFSEDETLENRFEYISMKPNLFFRLFKIIVVEKTDIKSVSQKLLLNNDWAWKTLVYGFSGDIDTISRLLKSFSTIEEALELNSLEKGVGIKSNDGSDDAAHLMGRELLNEKAIGHFSVDTEKKTIFNKRLIDRARTKNHNIFFGPYALLRRGFDLSNYTLRAAYCETDFIFKFSVYAIKGNAGQKNLLLNLTGLLNSTLYSYLNLMTSSFLGVEREIALFKEVLELPFVYSEEIASQVEKIHEMSKREAFAVAPNNDSEIKKLNEMILDAFGLADNQFVDYAMNVQIPNLAHSKKCKAFNSVSQQQLCTYTKPFLDALSGVFGVSGKFVSANIYPAITKYYSAVEIVLHDKKPNTDVQIIGEASVTKAMLTQFSAYKINDMFFAMKDVIHFDEDSFYIIKTSHYKNWHPAIAEIDLADVVNQILSKNGGDE